MAATDTTQLSLAALSGMRQPSISQILSGKLGVSDEQLRRLLACMGFELEVVRRPVRPPLTRSEWRSWSLHRRVAAQLDAEALERWTPPIRRRLERLEEGTRGEPHTSNLREWRRLMGDGDLAALRRVLTGLDRHSIEMREVSPLGGILSEDDRREALGLVG